MITIRTAEGLARVLSIPLDPTLHDRLAAQREHLQDFVFEQVALILIAQPGDTLAAVARASPVQLVQNSEIALLPEYVEQQGSWLEAVFILSDDGFGLVLLIHLALDMDPALLAACKALLPTLDLPAAR